MTDRFDEMAAEWCGDEFHRWVEDDNPLRPVRLAALFRRVHNEALEAAENAREYRTVDVVPIDRIRALKVPKDDPR